MLYRKQENDSLIWAVWKIDESIDELEEMLGYRLADPNPKRKKERSAVRLLLKELLGEDAPIFYKDSGKPYLKNGFHLSISHTRNYVSVSLSKSRSTGIDIEMISDKILRVKKKFISEKEYIDPQNEAMHLLIHWSAKEALYKITDREIECLKSDSILSPFSPQRSGQIMITDTRNQEEYQGEYLIDSDFALVVI